MTQDRTLVLGMPGTGKTERLLLVMESALRRGVPPERIGFCTFTKGAADVAKARACEKFGLQPHDFPNVRTLHSLCFRELGLRRRDVLGEEHLSELADITGELNDGRDADPDAPATRMNADTLMTLDGYARATCRTLRQAWDDHGGLLDWWRVLRFSEALRLYKADKGLIDFTDMLSKYLDMGRPIQVDVGIIDEAQDLTLLQWRVAMRAFENAQELWAAGDDDQSVHRWAGAAEDHLLNLGWAQEILPLSHRLPKAVYDFAGEIINKVAKRYAKPARPDKRQGNVDWLSAADEADLSSGNWLLLARTRYQLGALAQLAREQGVFYALKGQRSVSKANERAVRAYEALRAGKEVEAADCELVLKMLDLKSSDLANRLHSATDFPSVNFEPIWHDALVGMPLDDREYILACMRRGEKLNKPPRISIETMHGAKGLEADNVLLSTDMTPRVQKGYELDPDSEHRVWYVGATRAYENLFPVAAQTAYGFPL